MSQTRQLMQEFLTLPFDESEPAQAGSKLLAEGFRKRMDAFIAALKRDKRLPEPFEREFLELAERACELVRHGSLAERRTTGLSVLSRMVQIVHCRHLDEQGLLPVPMRYDRDVEEWEIDDYTTYLPSTVEGDANPDAELLLVGEAPAFAETKVGVPLVDLWNLASSPCAACKNFKRCFYDSVLLTNKGSPKFDARLFGCEFEPDDERATHAKRVAVPGMQCYTAGEVLRRVLVRARIGRSCWGDFVQLVKVDAWAVCTNALRETNLGPSTKRARGIANQPPDPKRVARDSPWLWFEAAMMLPKATVLLGNTALQGYQECSDSKRGGSGLIDFSQPFGAVYKTYHPSAVFKNGINPWSVESELESALTEQVSRERLGTGKWNGRAMLLHLHDTLVAAVRFALSGDPLDDSATGYQDIIPTTFIRGGE